MIPSSAVKAYLNAPRDDHRWLKRLSAQELDNWGIDPPPHLCEQIRLHQRVCVYLGIAYPAFAFFLDMGVGKTLVALELIRYWFEVGGLDRALVFVTSDKAYATWTRQVKRFNIDVPWVWLSGSSEDKWRQLRHFERGIIFVPYPGAVAMVSSRVKIKGKTKLAIDPEKFERLISGVGALVMDESTKAAGESLTNQLCTDISYRVPIRYALAGRPFGRDPTLLWKQYLMLDRGEALGETLGLFREAFFTAQDGSFWATKRAKTRKARFRAKHVKDWKFDKRKLPELTRLMQHRSLAYTSEECVDLPKLVPIVEEVKLPQEASAYYERVVASIIAARGNLREMKSAFIRMRQLSSGFLGFRDDTTDERAEVAFDENPKLDRLLELLEALPEDRKAIVFYEFTWSGRRIYEALKERGLGAVWLWSGTKDSTAALSRFMDKSDCQVVVLQNRVGAYSLDGLQVANYALFYESPVSVIDRSQAEKRLHRSGQERRVFQYDLVVTGTCDQKILDFHAEGADILAALNGDPRRVLGGSGAKRR